MKKKSVFISCIIVLLALAQNGYSQQLVTTAVEKPIDRYALVNRHNVILQQADPLAPLSVGNGDFAFTADITGMQSFEDYYYSRSSGPDTFFNKNRRGLYSADFADQTDKDFALSPLKEVMAGSENFGLINRMLYVDTKTSLPDDLLLKADKMTMANSIELRVPFLDHKLIEFAASLMEDDKVRGFTTKYIAKRALSNRIPDPILKRRKAGFPVPFGAWLRADLKQYVHEVLLDRATSERGYFNKSYVEGLLRANAESGLYSKEVLSLLTLELWHRAFNVNAARIAPEPARV